MIISAPDKPQETQDPHPLPTESVLPGPPPSAPVKPTTRVTRRKRLRLAIYTIVLLLLAVAIHSTRRRSRRPPKVFHSRPPFQPKQSHFTPERLPHIEKTFLYGYRLAYSYRKSADTLIALYLIMTLHSLLHVGMGQNLI